VVDPGEKKMGKSRDVSTDSFVTAVLDHGPESRTGANCADCTTIKGIWKDTADCFRK